MFPRRQPTPNRRARPPLRLLAAAGLAAGVAGFAPHGRTAAAGPAAAAEVADVHLARAALALLEADPALRDFNLVVSVVDRVAVVGGPVASAELKERAADLVRRVPGVRVVRNGCFIQAGLEPLLRAPAATAARPLPTLPPVVVPLYPRTAVEAPPPTGDLVAAAPPARPAPGERSVVARRPATPGENVLLPPVAAPTPTSNPGAPFTPIPPGPPAVLTGRPNLSQAVESVRRSEARFAGLRAEVREDGIVLVDGSARQAADAWDLAEILRGVPGVTRVAVGPVRR
jgi:hypothetical protein